MGEACDNVRIMWSEGSRLRRAILNAAADAVPDGVLVRHGPRSSNGVALTFDDGPDEHTGELLDLLDELEVRATFFLSGFACERFPQRMLDIVARGHEVCSHGYSHAPFPKLSHDQLLDEMRRMTEILPPQPRKRPLVRPPHGSVTTQSLLRCARAGYATVLWSLDSLDYRTTDPSVIEERLLTTQGGEIILLHEGELATHVALRNAVGSLRSRGLKFVTVSELIED